MRRECPGHRSHIPLSSFVRPRRTAKKLVVNNGLTVGERLIIDWLFISSLTLEWVSGYLGGSAKFGMSARTASRDIGHRVTSCFVFGTGGKCFRD